MELAAWISGREHAALRGVRLYGLCLCGALLAATAWLGWREATLVRAKNDVRVQIEDSAARVTFLKLSSLRILAYSAKIKRQALLDDITELDPNLAPCLRVGGIGNLPEDNPCRADAKRATRQIWQAATGGLFPTEARDLLSDSWGAPFIFEGAERGCPSMPDFCLEDVIRSAGPDGMLNTRDDIVVNVPRYLYQHLAPR